MTDTTSIRQATSSARMRIKIADVLKQLWKDARAAKTLEGHSSSYYAKQADFNKYCKVDAELVSGSDHMVTSGGVFDVLGDLENINTGGH